LKKKLIKRAPSQPAARAIVQTGIIPAVAAENNKQGAINNSGGHSRLPEKLS
jgi:hypothetical protein